MSAVIKALHPAAPGRVAAFRGGAPALADAVAPAERNPLLERALEAEARVAALEAAAREAGTTIEARVAEAREAGRREGFAAANDATDDRLRALGEGIGAAQAALDARLVALDGLAAMLAGRAVDKILADADDQRALVTAMVARNLATLGAELTLAVRVSASDFSDPASLDALTATTCRNVREVTAETDLASGCCRFDLTLGALDLSLTEQRRHLTAFLDGLAGRGPST